MLQLKNPNLRTALMLGVAGASALGLVAPKMLRRKTQRPLVQIGDIAR